MVDGVELHPDGSPVVHLSTGGEQARCCPQCGVRAARVKGWVLTRPRHLPVAGRITRLRWRPARMPAQVVHRAGAAGSGTGADHRPAAAGAGAAVADGNRTIVQAARDLGMSWPVVAAAFTAHAVAGCQPNPGR